MRRMAIVVVVLAANPLVLLPPPAAAVLQASGTQPAAFPEITVGESSTGGALPAGTADVTIVVSNTGPTDLTITSITGSIPGGPGGLSLACLSPCTTGLLGSGQTRSYAIRATAQSYVAGGTYSSQVQVNSDNGTVTVPLAIPVRSLRAPSLAPLGTTNVAATLPCPRPSFDTDFPFTLTFTNQGDYDLFVNGVSFAGITARSMSSNFFTIGPRGTLTRTYTVPVSPFQSEGTRTGDVSVATNRGTVYGSVSVVTTYPANVLLPSAPATPHAFGDVPLLTTPQSYPILARETCGYKSATVSLDNAAQVPSFASVGGPTWTIASGAASTIGVSVRFSSTHNGLLYQNQAFQVSLQPSTGSPVTYAFTARPVFINVASFKARLIEAGDNSEFPDANEAADTILELLVNRTEVRPPTTEAEIADASRLVALVEPTALLIEQFDDMRAWNEAGLQNETVRALVAGAAAHQTLVGVCEAVEEAALRTGCGSALGLLRDRSALFAEAAIAHFASLNATVRSDLERERAATGLSFALSSLGQTAAAQELADIAQGHFRNFTARLGSAANITRRIGEREARFDPWAFDAQGGRFVIWHPLGALLLESHVADSREDFARARSELVTAGDPIRLEQLDAERRAFENSLGASLWLNVSVLVAYGLGLVGLGVWALRGYAFARRMRTFGRLGNFLLPENRPR